MLERRGFLIAAPPSDADGALLAVRDADDPAGEWLGVAVAEPRCRLAVSELPDHSLVFTVERRRWPRRGDYKVRDANAVPVGTVRVGGRRSALRLTVRDRTEGRIPPDSPCEPAVLRWVSGGALRLDVAAELDGEPFAKMLLLAAALVAHRMSRAEPGQKAPRFL